MAKFESLGIEEWDFVEVWILEKLQRFVWKMLLEGKVCHPAIFPRQIVQISLKFKLPLNSVVNARTLKLVHFARMTCSFDFWNLFYDYCDHFFFWWTRSGDIVLPKSLKLLAPQKKRVIAFEFLAYLHDHLECPDWSSHILFLFKRHMFVCKIWTFEQIFP